MSNLKQELKLPTEPSVFIDQKTEARTFAMPFKLPDGTNAVLMITRLKGFDWKPAEVIKSVTINYVKN